ncbi:YveK family protein [Enterococcus rivorum]|uniref:Capsular polysaccharide biosynthesis protein CpsC n=1 Tax=Enterococcus rivorum TaxID=762845 RepID=A0A1E5KX90_9ENTE|nr:Wzz/FepE/Etk N-terminal domain-containing protein [Enterococcus rivorum]MBP2097207.1 capsular polysaccharide biosynthesis protein [Enterococcus rivorum]OEH82438.1 tyrosine protein kinase [Enterococcus rivorum]
MEETISLQEIFGILKKRIGLILISMFLGLGLTGLITFFVITPKYSSQAQLIVRLPQTETANVNDINANLQMITTYKDLIKSDSVMGEVQQKMKNEFQTEMTVSSLRESIEVEQSQNSQMFSIVSTGTNGIVSQNIANQTALVFQEKAKDMLNVDKITIISDAVASGTPVSPNNKLNLMIGVLLGAMIGIGISFVLELFDKTIKDARFVEEELGLTILGVVPNMTVKELNTKIIRSNSDESGMQIPLDKKDFKEDRESDTNEDDQTFSRRSRSRL